MMAIGKKTNTAAESNMAPAFGIVIETLLGTAATKKLVAFHCQKTEFHSSNRI